MKISNSQPVFQNLNGLRFIGALSVFLFHTFTLSREMWGDFHQTAIFQAVYKLASKGHFGVGLFFVLSGFLITTLMLRELKENQTIHVKNFFFRRILRIWPVYFSLTIFGFFLFPHLLWGVETVHSLGYYSLFLSNLDEIRVGANDPLTFLTVSWSVSVEEQFYMLLFFVLGVFPFLRRKKTLFVYFLSLLLVCILFRGWNEGNERVIYFHSFSVMSDLAVGGLLAFLVFENKHRFMLKISRIQIILIYIFGSLLLLFSRQIFVGKLVAIERLLQSLFFAFVLLDQMFSTRSWFKADRLPGFFFSGNITYGFYMYHCISLYYWAMFFQTNGWTNSIGWFVLYIVLNFISTYSFSLISYFLMEKPFLSLKKNFR